MATGAYLLDTNIVIHLARGDALGRYLVQHYGFALIGYTVSVSIVTKAEAMAFADLNVWGSAKHAALADWLASFEFLPIDDDLVQAYIDLDLLSRNPPAGAGFTGRRMGKNDLWIAATALHHGLPLLTTGRDFDHLAGVLRLEYIDPASGTP